MKHIGIRNIEISCKRVAIPDEDDLPHSQYTITIICIDPQVSIPEVIEAARNAWTNLKLTTD